jgi:hypothetical protein
VGRERVACLVAHHSGARTEAEERGLLDALEFFPEERSLIADVLTYCDLTTTPDGSAISAWERLSDVATRYGDDHPVGRAVRRSREELLTLVNRVAAVKGDRATAEGHGRGRVRARQGGAAA